MSKGRQVTLAVAVGLLELGLAVACSQGNSPLKYLVTPDEEQASGGAGARGFGGTGTGGTASGTGGRSTGGSATGGSATGGTASGGRATGGTGTGSTTTGGSSTGGKATGGAATGGAATGGASTSCQNFSFFLASLAAMQRLSGTANGFGGDLRYGQADGLSGADKICATIAATALPCASSKTWRAFLSTSSVDAIDRIGSGPWYDRNGLLVWNNLGEMTADRPPATYTYRDDLPNEDGIPNHDYDLDGTTTDDDNHDVLTGSGIDGRKSSDDTAATRCNDWTSLSPTASGSGTGGRFGGGFGGGNGPWCGHSWPRQGSGTHWIHSIREGGCGACVNLLDTGGPTSACVGSGGGYGGIYCFATSP
jgi:hypothetical protein